MVFFDKRIIFRSAFGKPTSSDCPESRPVHQQTVGDCSDFCNANAAVLLDSSLLGVFFLLCVSKLITEAMLCVTKLRLFGWNFELSRENISI